jgi:hypothetical protein
VGLHKIGLRSSIVSVSFGGGFLLMVMVVEREDATGACYWKVLPTRTLVFER